MNVYSEELDFAGLTEEDFAETEIWKATSFNSKYLSLVEWKWGGRSREKAQGNAWQLEEACLIWY